MLFLTTIRSAKPVKLEEMVMSEGLNHEEWLIDAMNAELAKHKAKRLDKFSRCIYDVDKLQEITGLKREKHAANKIMWPVWY